jgi:hypothetical protein
MSGYNPSQSLEGSLEGTPFNEIYGQYASFDEAYPTETYGRSGELCRSDRDCTSGLYCLGDPNSNQTVCSFPQDVNPMCTRSSTDQKCHRISYNGQKIYCPDNFCPPIPPPIIKPVDAVACANAESYFHSPSQNKFCIYIDQRTGQALQQPEKCCNPLMAYNGDLEEEYLKYNISPQYYGVYR